MYVEHRNRSKTVMGKGYKKQDMKWIRLKCMADLYEDIFVKAITMYNKYTPLNFYFERSNSTSPVVNFSGISLAFLFRLSSMHSDEIKSPLHTCHLKNSAAEYIMPFRNRDQRPLNWSKCHLHEDKISWYQKATCKLPKERSNQKSYPAMTSRNHTNYQHGTVALRVQRPMYLGGNQ